LLKIIDLSARVRRQGHIEGHQSPGERREVHAIMGPNGSGKSTLAQVLAGREDYEVTGGSVTFEGRDLFGDARRGARPGGGCFWASQYPVEIPASTTSIC